MRRRCVADRKANVRNHRTTEREAAERFERDERVAAAPLAVAPYRSLI